MKDRVIVVFGPTGTAGSGAIEACLDVVPYCKCY
jgi:hypothetical protein